MMSRRIPVALLLPLAAFATTGGSSAQPSADVHSLTWLHGDWAGKATIFGRPAQVRLSVGPTLRGTATALTYTATIPASQGQAEFLFEGRGTYRVKPNGEVIGQWNDSQGNFHPLAGRIKGTKMTVTWGEPRTEVGHSSYELASDGTLAVRDSEFGRGEMRTFSQADYRRVR